MENELEGGASEGLGPNGRHLRYYVIGTAKTPKRHINETSNNSDAPDVLHDIPLPRTAVEQIFVDAGINLDTILTQHFPVQVGETADKHKERVLNTWHGLWRERAVGPDGLFVDHQGLERSNLMGNGAGEFRWDVRRQRLREMTESHLNPVDALTRTRAIQRLRIIWSFLKELNPELRELLLPHLQLIEEEGFASLDDEAFLPQHWKYDIQVEQKGDELILRSGLKGVPTGLVHVHHIPHAYATDSFLASIKQEIGADALKSDFQDDHWKIATLDVFSEQEVVTKFRYEFGRGPKPDVKNGQASVLPSESQHFSLPGAGLGNMYDFKDGRVDLGPLHSKAKESWSQLKTDEEFYIHFRDGGSVSEQLHAFQTISKELGSEPRTFWGRSLQGLFLRHNVMCVNVKTLAHGVDSRQDLKECLKGFQVTEIVIDSMLDKESKFYDESQEDDEAGAFINLLALINSERRIIGVVWCQNWESTNEGSVLNVKASQLFEFGDAQEGTEATLDSQPWTEGDKQEFITLDNGLKHSLYLRASGSRAPNFRRLVFMLELYAIAENAHGGYNGIISRVPRASEHGFSPNFAALADQVLTLGLQRAVAALSPIAQDEENAKEAIIEALSDSTPAATYAADAMDIFSFRKNEDVESMFGPFLVSLAPVQSQAGYTAALKNSAPFFAPQQPSFSKWNEWSKKPELMQQMLKSYYSARVYHTASQLLGSYTILHELLRGINNNMLMGGEIPSGALTGGSHRLYMLDEGVQQSKPSDDDGRLTTLEHSAHNISEDLLWQGTFAQLKKERK